MQEPPQHRDRRRPRGTALGDDLSAIAFVFSRDRNSLRLSIARNHTAAGPKISVRERESWSAFLRLFRSSLSPLSRPFVPPAPSLRRRRGGTAGQLGLLSRFVSRRDSRISGGLRAMLSRVLSRAGQRDKCRFCCPAKKLSFPGFFGFCCPAPSFAFEGLLGLRAVSCLSESKGIHESALF